MAPTARASRQGLSFYAQTCRTAPSQGGSKLPRLAASMAMAFPNMNLQDYVISPTPGTKRPGVYNTKWSEYPNGVESFDVYMGPITHLYSQVLL